jgi:glycerophosphoryl diester phosphodiesterase
VKGTLSTALIAALVAAALVPGAAAQAQNRWREPKAINIAHQGASVWILGGTSPGPGVVTFQVPITFALNDQLLKSTTKENVARAHAQGYAWQNWFSSDDRDYPPSWRRLVDMCVDGIMTSQPAALERVLRKKSVPADCR